MHHRKERGPHPASSPGTPTRRRRRDRPRLSGVRIGASVAVAAVLASAGTFAIAESSPDITVTAYPAAADTYVVEQYPQSAYGTARKLTAAHWRNWKTEAYVLFDVPTTAGTAVSATVELTLERRDHRPARLRLRSLSAGGWSEEYTSYSTKPEPGRVVATTAVDGQDDTVSFDVSPLVRGPGRYAFAVSNDDGQSVASAHSSEQGAKGPRLLIGTVRGDAPPPPAATSAPPTLPTRPSPRPPASAPVTPGPRPSPSATRPPPPAPVPQGRTLCGASFTTEKGGESYQEALHRIDGLYNGLELVRIFYPGRPAEWPGKLDVGKRPVVVSFKFPPAEVAAGQHDAYMREWFATAPRDQDVYWTFYHEPEQEVAAGDFSTASFRAAWKRLRQLADEAKNDRLTATLILMDWTVDPRSGRNWREFYPGRDVVQVMGWDPYNPPGEVSKGVYLSPAALFKRIIDVSRAEDLPFAIAETGSFLAKGDNGAERAAWLRSMVRHLTQEGALFIAYFDLDWETGDFRLRDQHSITAWREFCS
ncbi:MAG TPA: DNRLRE domain-containing protein [Pilimelia sp.]|nr:DNRLRE domain-containing protein [Pilimelia sp.]